VDTDAEPLSPLAVLGFDATAEELYRTLLRSSPVSIDVLAASVRRPRADVVPEVRRLESVGLADLHGDTVVAAAPERALREVIDEEDRRLGRAQHQLDQLRRMLPSLAAEHMVAGEPRGEVVGLEVLDYERVLEVIQRLTLRATDDLLWIRPEQWRAPEGGAIDEWVSELLRRGRRSRVIYPARALEEAPDTVRRRAELGEHVRLLADVPGLLGVLGDAAIMREQLDGRAGRLLLVRHPALVAVIRTLFEELWQRALAVPGMEGEAGESATRRLLLEQLTRGAKDEQIARELGLSLRTVRRRVAEVLGELGADSRFQAGVEAVRRGWI
jgi:hypothetical protein